MSFILDALKKAESERSRQSGPVLMDVRIAAPRRQLPAWAWVLGVVLLANLGVLAWLLLRAPAPAPAVIAAQAPPAVPAPAAVVAPVIVPAATPVSPVAPAATPLPALIPEDMPATLPAPPSSATDTTLDVDNVPTMQDMIASAVTLPAMQLNLHVYDDAPANRYVLLNSRRLREGDELPDGIKLVRITPRGVVLNARGRLFLLAAGG
jgi:general secretion pathway protein B